MSRQKKKRYKSSDESSEPRKSEAAVQHGRIGDQIARAFQDVIKPGAHQPADPCDADNQKTFVAMTWLFCFLQVAMLQKTFASPVKIRLQHICGDQESSCDHQPKCGNRKRTKMEKWNHRWRSFSPSAVYTRRILAPSPVQRGSQNNPNPKSNPLRRRKVTRENR